MPGKRRAGDRWLGRPEGKNRCFPRWDAFPRKKALMKPCSPPLPQTQLTTDIMPDQKTFVDQKAGGSRHRAGRILPLVPILLLMLAL